MRFGLLVILPFGLIEIVRGDPGARAGHSVHDWLIALAIGILGFACSFLLYNYALASIAASRASIILNLMPIFGVAAAAVVLGERISVWQMAGAILIIASIFIFPAEVDPVTEEAPAEEHVS